MENKSYSYTVKESLCKSEFDILCLENEPHPEDTMRPPYCCAASFLYAVLLISAKMTSKGLKFKCENQFVLDLCSYILVNFFDIEVCVISDVDKDKFHLCISENKNIEKLKECFGDVTDGKINTKLLNCRNCRSAFLEGVFVACGTVMNPEKRYHLEFSVSSKILAQELCCFFESEFHAPKVALRKAKYVLYFKESEKIEDFLVKIGAQKYALEIIEQKIVKDIRNNINRISNFDSANLEKTVGASQEALEAIRKIKNHGRFSTLPEELKVTARLREKFPDMTLSELREKHKKEISKSGLNHRLKKIIQISKTL